MKKKSVMTIACCLLFLLGIAILYIGVSGEKIILPPVITGLGFFVISWVLFRLKE